MRYSLGFILALSLAGLQFLAILVVVSTSYVSSERAMLEHARGLLDDASLSAIDQTRRFLDPAREAAELSSRMIEAGIIDATDPAALEQLMLQLLQDKPQMSGIFYGDEAGNFTYVMRSDGPGPFRSKFVTVAETGRTIELIWRTEDGAEVDSLYDPTDTFDPRERQWYIDASRAGASVWTDPYIFFSSQRPGITVAAPVESGDGMIRGVVGVDVEIADISSFLSRLPIGDQGAALILNQDGNVIAHPEFANISVQNADGTLSFVGVADSSDPLIRAAFANVDLGDDLSDPGVQSGFDHAGQTYLTLFRPLTDFDLPWIISIFVPENDFIQGIKDNRLRNIWIAAFVSLATAIAGVTLAELILRPVRAFAVRTALVSQGEMSADEPLPRTYQELRDANQTLLDEISQRRQSEAKVQELHHELAHASRVNVMGQMATGLAHELSQPLTAISQNVDTAISLAKQDPDHRTELLSILSELDEQAHQGGDIIRSLRGFVRKEIRGAEEFDLTDLIEQTCRLMRHETDSHNVAVSANLDLLPRITGNRVETAQILTNLMRNAVEAMVQANSKAKSIVITARQVRDAVEISVEDSGPGIDDAVVLFKQFQTSKSDGLGLGLTISRAMAEANGGRLWHDAQNTETTRFCFTVPIVAPDA